MVHMCVKKPEEMLEKMMESDIDMSPLNEDTGFWLMHGKCRDPCSLKFMPEMTEEMMEFMMSKFTCSMLSIKH